MMRCINCGFENSDDSKFCGKCGSSLEPENKKIEEYFSHINDDFYEEFRTDNNKEGITAKDNSSFENIEQNEREFFNEEDSSDEEDSFLEKIKEHKKNIKKNKTQSKHKKKISEINKTSIIKDKRKLIIITAVIMVILVSFVGYNLFTSNGDEEQILKYIDVLFVKDKDKMLETEQTEQIINKPQYEAYYSTIQEVKSDFDYVVLDKLYGDNVGSAEVRSSIFSGTMENIDYKVQNMNIKNNEAEVELELNTPNYKEEFSDIIGRAMYLYTESNANYFSNNTLKSTAMLGSILKAHDEDMSFILDKTETTSIKLHFTKNNDVWILDNKDDLKNILFKDMMSSFQSEIDEIMPY